MDLLGVNLAGAEFGSVGQPYGTGYTYPTHAEIDYYAASGMNVIRLPFLWERLQPTLDGALDKDELARIDDVVSYATSKGLKVDLDVHNYGKYNGQLIGTPAVPTSAFADLWGKLAGHFASNSNVMFGLMNEPQQSDATSWLQSVNAAIGAIRSAGATQEVLVPGINWDGAWTWAGTPNATVIGTGVVDPLKNYAFEVHQYLDSDGSGTTSQVASADTGVTRLEGATQWAEQTGQKLFLGEFGVATDSTSLAALKNMLAYMNQHSDAWQGATYWAGGPWWWGSNIYGIEPTGLGTATVTDQPQMAILKEFEGTSPVAGSGGGVATATDPGPQQTLAASIGSLEAGQAEVIGTAAPGLPGQTLTLQQTGGSGTVSLGPVQADGTSQILVAAPSHLLASTTTALTYILTDSQSGATTQGSANVSFDAGPSVTATVPAAVGHGKTVTIATVAKGLAGDTLQLVSTGGSPAGTLALDGTSVTYTAPQTVTAGQTDSFSYVIRDQHNAATANGTGSVRLDPGPTTGAVSVTVGHDRTTDLTTALRTAVQPGLAGDTLTFLSGSGTKGALVVTNGTVTYTSVAAGSDSLSYVVGDQVGDTARGTATLTIDPGPKTGAVNADVKLGASIDLTATILGAAMAGIKGDQLTIQSASAAGTLGTVSVIGGDLVYTATGGALSAIAAGSTQSDHFSYAIADQYGDIATGSASLSVSNPAVPTPTPSAPTPVSPASTPATTASATPTPTPTAPVSDPAGTTSTSPASTTTASVSSAAVLTSASPSPTPIAPASTPAPTPAPSPSPPPTGTATLSFVGYNHTIALGNGSYAITAGQGSARVTLGDGNDRVTLAGYNNSVTAGNGNDVVTGGLGSDTIVLGNGNNTVNTSGYGNQIQVGSGTNTVVAGSGSDAVTAGSGTNAITLAGYGNRVVLNGGASTVSGSQGSDTFTLNGGHHTVTTGGWNEHLIVGGAATANIMDLGHGLKLDVMSSTQTDTITGFGNDGAGVIGFIGSAGGFSSVDDVMNALRSDNHGGTLLSLGKSGSIDLVNTAQSTLHATNFRVA